MLTCTLIMLYSHASPYCRRWARSNDDASTAARRLSCAMRSESSHEAKRGRQLHLVAHGILQQRHPQPPAIHVVEPLVEEDHVHGEGPRAVVGADARGERREIRVEHMAKAHLVGIALRVVSAKVVRDEDVVLVRRADGATELVLELLVDDVRGGVSLGELLPRRQLDERVEFGLAVVLLRTERQLQRDPDGAGVAPPLRCGTAHRLGHLGVLGEDGERRVGLCAGHAPHYRKPPHELPARQYRELARGVIHLELAQQAIVRDQHLTQQDVARPRRRRAP